MINRIIHSDTDTCSIMKLYSSLFILVDSELSRIHIMDNCPVWYRRMASMAQASVIYRGLYNLDFNKDSFINFALTNSGNRYYMQNYADMRCEPRWFPLYGLASQLHSDFLGRINIAAHDEITDQITTYDSELSNSIKNIPIDMYAFFPGPLEGGIDFPDNLPDEFKATIENEIKNPNIEASSFVSLICLSFVYKMPSEYPELASSALKTVKYRILNPESRNSLVNTILGLASIACTARNSDLANEVLIITRRYRSDLQFKITLDEALIIGLTAAAAHSELNKWISFAGDWITELSFSNFDKDEGKELYSRLSALLKCVPELWHSTGRAEAALNSVILN